MSPESLHVLRFRVISDGAVRADLPLADFARSSGPAAPQVLPQRSVLMGEDDDGWLYSWLPMPHRQSMTVSLHVDDSSTDHAIEAQVRAEAGPVAPQAAPFFAVLADR